MENLIEKYLEPKYDKHTFIIYPISKVNKFDKNFGKYNISSDKYVEILNYMKKNFNTKRYNQTKYKYNEMELIIQKNNHRDEIQYKYNKYNYIYQELLENNILNIIKIKTMDQTCFPILNKYNEEVIQDIYECKMNYIKLFLIKENNINSFYISFYYNNDKDNVIKELTYLNKIIDKLYS